MDLVTPYYIKNDLEGACDRLLKEAFTRWTAEEDTIIDDITFIIIFLYH